MEKLRLDPLVLDDVSDEEVSTILRELPPQWNEGDEDNLSSGIAASKTSLDCEFLSQSEYEILRHEGLIRIRKAEIAAHHKKIEYEQKLVELEERERQENARASNWCVVNVGGCHFETTIGTLKKIPLIAGMVIGDALQIDRDGSHFRQVLNYLRNPEVFDIDKYESYGPGTAARWELQIEAIHYGLFSGLFPGEEPPQSPRYTPRSKDTVTEHREVIEIDMHVEEGGQACGSCGQEGDPFAGHGLVLLKNGRRGSARLQQRDALEAKREGQRDEEEGEGGDTLTPYGAPGQRGRDCSRSTYLMAPSPPPPADTKQQRYINKQSACKDASSSRSSQRRKDIPVCQTASGVTQQTFVIDSELGRLQAPHKADTRKRLCLPTSTPIAQSVCTVTVAEDLQEVW